MPKAAKRKYSESSGTDVKSEMHRYKRCKAKSGPGGKGGTQRAQSGSLDRGNVCEHVFATTTPGRLDKAIPLRRIRDLVCLTPFHLLFQ